MSPVTNKTTITPPNAANPKRVQAQTLLPPLAGVHNNEDWLWHYEWEGTNLLGLVFTASKPLPAAPLPVQALIDDLLF